MRKKASIEIPLQFRNNEFIGLHYIPYGDEAIEKSKEFLINQIIEGKLWGSKKARSLKQLGLYWKCCDVVAEQTSDHENLFSKEDIDFEVKTKIAKDNPSMIKRFTMISGIVYIEPISIAFANMKHLEACKYFDKAFLKLADRTQMTVDKLIELAKSKMG